MTDLDTIRDRHWQNPDGKCASGDHAYPSAWPCDTRVVLDALDRADAASVDDAAAIQEFGRDLIEAQASAANHNSAYAAARADADRLAEALQSDDDGYCRECKRMVCEWDERRGYPTALHDRLDLHADDCKTGHTLRQHDAVTRQSDPDIDGFASADRTAKSEHNPSDTGIVVETPCDCGTVDCAIAALDATVKDDSTVRSVSDRPDVSPEMPAPGYTAQTRPICAHTPPFATVRDEGRRP